MLENQPYRTPEGTGEMSSHAVDGDNEVELEHRSSCIYDGLGLVRERLQRKRRMPPFRALRTLLKTVKPRARDPRERRQALERNRPATVPLPRGPDQADMERFFVHPRKNDLVARARRRRKVRYVARHSSQRATKGIRKLHYFDLNIEVADQPGIVGDDRAEGAACADEGHQR